MKRPLRRRGASFREMVKASSSSWVKSFETEVYLMLSIEASRVSVVSGTTLGSSAAAISFPATG